MTSVKPVRPPLFAAEEPLPKRRRGGEDAGEDGWRSDYEPTERGGDEPVVNEEDLDELFALSDRLFVMYEGAIVHESSPRQTTPREVGLVMTGHGVE